MWWFLLYVVIACITFKIGRVLTNDRSEDTTGFIFFCSVGWILTVPVALTIFGIWGIYKLISLGIDYLIDYAKSYFRSSNIRKHNTSDDILSSGEGGGWCD